MIARGLCLILSLFLAAPALAEVSAYAGGAVQVVSKATLGPRQKAGFAKFRARAKDFHGVYYISKAGDKGSFWVDEHRLEDAKTYAKAACEEQGAGPCMLYAQILPAGAPKGRGPLVKGINASLSRDLIRHSGKGDPGTFGAAAVNRMGQNGMGWGYESRERARKEALFTCIKGIDRQVFKDQVSAQVYNQAVSQGRFDCRLVAEFRK